MRTAFDTTWYVEQEKRIKAASEEGARLRREMRQRFDPGHVYVVEFDSGVLKVGKSASPAHRLEQHAKAGLVRRTWVSARHLGCSATERKVLSYCAEFGQLHGGREYFTGLDFSSVLIRSVLVVDDALHAEIDSPARRDPAEPVPASGIATSGGPAIPSITKETS